MERAWSNRGVKFSGHCTAKLALGYWLGNQILPTRINVDGGIRAPLVSQAGESVQSVFGATKNG
jgi:hypothetical protein